MKSIFTIFLLIITIKVSGQTIASNDTTAKLTTEFRNKIISESRNGGKLDFWTPIKGHEYDGAMIVKGATAAENIYASNKEIAVIKWVLNLTKLGVKKNDVIYLYEALKGRKIRDDEISLVDLGIKNYSE
ncbi:MAG: hypothetical protein JWR12_2899 [Mucilaginibacter sp.]|nr:hypothetical protein [Mucilaginibacter sp.]